MLMSVRRWLQAAPIADPIDRQQAPMVQVILLGLIAVNLSGIPITLLVANPADGSRMFGITTVLLGFVLYLGCLMLIRRGRFSLAIVVAVLSMTVLVALLLVPQGLRSSWLSFLAITYPITFAGLVGTRRIMWLAIVLSIVVVLAIGVLEQVTPWLVGYASVPHIPFVSSVIIFAVVISFLGLSFDRFGSTLRETLVLALRREHELEHIRTNQEATIAARTQALQQALVEVEQRETRLARTLDELRASQAVVQDLSAPVIPVLPGVLVAPLVGAINTGRADMLMGNVLRTVELHRARYIIFDITGVPLVDTHVAKVILEAANAIRLLGGRVFMVGVRPEVAQTIVNLDLGLGAVEIYPTLQTAVEALLLRDGWIPPARVAIPGRQL